MRGLLAVAVVIAAFAVGVSSASAAPANYQGPQAQCEQQGGTFVAQPQGTGLLRYDCRFESTTPGGSQPLSHGQLQAAEQRCENVHGGEFFATENPRSPGTYHQYGCVNIPSE